MEKQDQVRKPVQADTGMSMMLMMGLMMGLCFGTVLLFGLAPVVGWPVAIALALLGLGAMAYLHQRLMGHGRH